MLNDERLDLWSLDECHFQQHGTRCRMWVPCEDRDPIVLQASTRKSVALFGAVSLRTGTLVTMFAPRFNAATFESFLTLLLQYRHPSHPFMVTILDNAKYHHAVALDPFFEHHDSVLRADFLPPYSPKLSPVERVWKYIRKLATHNQYFATLDELLIAVKNQLEQFAGPNQTLLNLCRMN